MDRRTFLAGAAVAAAPIPAAATPAMTPHEQALWHVKELERLIREDGGVSVYIAVMGHYGPYAEQRNTDVRAIISHDGRLDDRDGMFA